MPTLLTLRDAGVSFGGRSALRGVTLDLPASGACAVLGANGSGKTTLLRLLAGVLAPTSGHVACASPSRTRAALVAQTVALYPFLTPRENCLAAGRMSGLRGAALRSQTASAIARALCGEVRDLPVKHLSGGYQRRAAVAVALMGDSPLVVLDEPTTGLDAPSATAMASIVRDMASAGKSVVFATHDFAFADATAGAVLLLRDGEVVASGAPERLCGLALGSQRHVEIGFGREPAPAQLDLLRAMRARRLAMDRWTLFSEVDRNGAAAAVGELRGQGPPPREVRVSEPGAAALFELYCQARPSS